MFGNAYPMLNVIFACVQQGPVGTSDNFAVTKSPAQPGSMAAMNGFSGTLTIHMKEMEG